MSFAVACGAKRTTAKEPWLGALARPGPLGTPCSFTMTAAMTTACTKIATTAAAADQASVRGVSLDNHSDKRPPRSNERWRRGARACSASIAANSFSMARADGAPSVSLRSEEHTSELQSRQYLV